MSLILNKDNFEETIASSKPVLVDFYADWCMPCKRLAPLIDEIATENSDFIVAKINVDESPELASRFSVQSIPTLVSFKDGKEYKRSVGSLPKDEIIALVN